MVGFAFPISLHNGKGDGRGVSIREKQSSVTVNISHLSFLLERRQRQYTCFNTECSQFYYFYSIFFYGTMHSNKSHYESSILWSRCGITCKVIIYSTCFKEWKTHLWGLKLRAIREDGRNNIVLYCFSAISKCLPFITPYRANWKVWKYHVSTPI